MTSRLVPVLIVVVAAGIIVAIIWLALQEQDAGAQALEGVSVEGPLPVTVPYREVGGSIVIDVTLGEEGRSVPMILDTGAPTIVAQDVAAAYAGEPRGAIAGASADGQVITSDVVPLPRLAIGEAVFHDVGAVVGAIEPGNPFYCITEAGFIGASLMQAAAWQIDPVTSSVTIAATADDLDTGDAVGIPFTPSSDISPSPLVALPAGEGTLELLVDTGSNGWLAVHPDDLAALGVTLPADAPTVSTLGTGAAGSFATRARWLQLELGLGGERAVLPLAAVEAVPPGEGNAGTDFLRHFIATLDWDGQLLYLEPVDEARPRDPFSAGLGWDDGYVVGSYVEGWPANVGLELGAEVSAIDGDAVAGAPFDDYCTRVVRGDPVPFRMTVGGEAPLTVEVAPLEGFFEP